MTKKIKLKISARLLKKKFRKQSFKGKKHCRFCSSAESCWSYAPGDIGGLANLGVYPTGSYNWIVADVCQSMVSRFHDL